MDSPSMSEKHLERSSSLLDFSSSFGVIEAMDPSLSDGFRLVYDREVPFELRTQESAESSQDIGSNEQIRVKVLVLGEDSRPKCLRVELTSESDLFFHYSHTVDATGFRTMQEHQKLMCSYEEYAVILSKMLNNCIRDPKSHLAVFIMLRDGRAQLDFIQNMEFKFAELLSVDFFASTDDVVRQHISFRYNSAKSKLALMQARLQDVNALVKVKNPSLLLQINRTPGGQQQSRNSPSMGPSSPSSSQSAAAALLSSLSRK